ncbi:MAG: asparaginase [Ramlibacter sp.]
MTRNKIVVLATGGTIAGTAANAHDTLGYSAAQLGVEDLLSSVPGLDGFDVTAEQVAQVDSKDMSFEIWRDLALRCAHWLAQTEVQGIVVTHGTDTLEETAYFLQAVFAPSKPIVFACAMRPATALLADGPQNLADAIAVAATPGARGVMAVCASQVHAALNVAKRHPYLLDAFESGEAGPIAFVENGQLRQVNDWPAAGDGAVENFKKVERAVLWPRVEIVMNYAGASAATVDALVAQGVDGIVAAGTGNGTLHNQLAAALLRAKSAGVQVIRSTRCAQGRVLGGVDGGLPDSAGLSPVKARIALMLTLMR